MNKNRFQLVFSKLLNMLIPVSEGVRSCIGKTQRSSRNLKLTVFKLLVGVSIVNTAWGEMVLPAGIIISDVVGTRVIASDATKIHFEQLAPKAIVDFNSLNLVKGQQFNVDMQANWSMLNRIYDANPSFLNGLVNAAGSIYFINSNGIIIGPDAQFNVGSLYAGTLNITNQLFQDGFVNEQTFTSPFTLVATLNLPSEDRQKIENAQVLVESGARINATNNGKVMLFAPNVKVEENAIIRTPEGQTILAAGKQIWLRGASDPAGFLVEVDAGGTATNLGQLIADRGNISMMGLSVNQLGTVSASTTVRANGSIRLVAQDKVSVSGVSVTGARNGLVTLGNNSVTEVKPEVSDKEETIVSQPFKTSEILIEASMININGAVNAKGGNVNVLAAFDASPLLATQSEQSLNNGTTRRIMLGSNASIDVSGVDAIAPMSRNEIEVQLFSDQLKDAPILRDSSLFRNTVFVDARKGVNLFDVQPFIDLKLATVAERMINAGSVNLATNQELIISSGATINVSGGSTTYQAGTIRESQLSFNSQLIPISQALPGVPYNKIADNFTINDPRWGTTENLVIGGSSSFVRSYFEGGDAGTINLTTPIDAEITSALVMSGNLLANTRVSKEQLISQKIPLGGQLIASGNNISIDAQATILSSQFTFADNLVINDIFSSSIDTSFLKNGFNRIDFTKVNQVSINQQLNLTSHGYLTIGTPSANSIARINANIIAPNSDLTFKSLLTDIADNVTISSAGLFTNDSPGISGALTQSVSNDGGNITLGITKFGQNLKLDASSGASLNFAGLFRTGAAGNIAFETYDALPDNMILRSFGFNRGGELSISFGDNSAKRNLFVDTNFIQDDNNIFMNSTFFRSGGFSQYKLKAFNINIGDNLAQDQIVTTNMQNWSMDSGFSRFISGQEMDNVASVVTLPSFRRQASSLWFESSTSASEESVNNLGTVTLGSNTTLQTDRGGNVTMQAGKQVNILGNITAPSGQITLSINDVNSDIEELPNQMVFIGNSASLNVSGSIITMPDSRSNFLNKQVVAAGSININARQAALLKGSVVMKEGSTLDVSGVSAVNDTKTSKGFIRETLNGDAGTININGSGSMLLDGIFFAKAEGNGRDGNLNILFNPLPFTSQIEFPNNSGQFFLTQIKQLSADGLNVGDALKNNLQPATVIATARLKGQISVAQIEDAGFANVSLKNYLDVPSTASRFVISENAALTLGGNLLIDSPITQVANQGNVSFTAGHITLRSPNPFLNQSLLDTATSLQGNGHLSINANQIYIDGVTILGGVNQANLNAEYDIHGQGVRSNVQLGTIATDGGLISNGQLNLTARQIYPESGGRLTLRAMGTDSLVNVNVSQKIAAPVLSAGGILNLQASSIIQNGVLSAPFGVINLISDQITLGANSTTSVSANNAIIPFGKTTTAGEVFNPSQGQSRPLIESEINLQASSVDLKTGAKLDLSAGGDLFAYEWIPGLGGSTDILAQPNTYAVIQNFSQVFAPKDLNMSQSSAQAMVGKTIFLLGGNGLPTGEYTLLPARYALVPGAFVVQLKPNGNLLPGQTVTQFDGSVLTTGYFGDFSTGARDAQLSTFRFFSGALFRPVAGEVLKAPSQYALTSASLFFTDPAKTDDLRFYTPLDVAKLGLNASQLSFGATVVANNTLSGRGLLVDIGADKIRIVNNKDNTDTQSLQISTAELNNLGAQSVLLGGTRNINQNGQIQINTVANTIKFENDSDQVIATPELLATARDLIKVFDGAVINSGIAAANAPTVDILTKGDGALLALSSNQKITYIRDESTTDATSGELVIGEQSRLLAGNSAILDATKNVTLKGSLDFQAQANVTLGANRVLIGDAPIDERGLKIDDATLENFSNLSSLTINSYSNLDTFGSVIFGAANLNLTINAAGIVGNAANGASDNQVTINANQLTLQNTQSATLTNANLTASRLTINANTVNLLGKSQSGLEVNSLASKDKFNIQGFNQVILNADEVRTSAIGETVFNAAQVDINVDRIGAQSGANYIISASNLLQTRHATSKPLFNDVFAGQLTIKAHDLVIDSRIESNSGIVTLQAQNNLILKNNAVVSANSQISSFADVIKAMPAGEVNLIANGNIDVDAGALITVNAENNANGGLVNIKSTQGALTLVGELRGVANGSGSGAKLDIDVKDIADFNATNSKAVGFNSSREYRVRQGNVLISGVDEQSLIAQKIRITADTGHINVTGDIRTDSANNGSIGLYAQNGLTLSRTATLDASSSDNGAKGGRIDLHTSSGSLDLEPEAIIDVSGGIGAQGGSVHLRTPRTFLGNNVAVNQLASTILGSDQTVLEAFRIFDNVNSISAGVGDGAELGFDTIANDVSNFMSNKTEILSGLDKTDDTSFVLRAGTEIRANNNLSIGTRLVDWNLFPTSSPSLISASDVGVLTLRAGGNLQFSGSLSDGFSTANRNLVSTNSAGLLADHTWSYRLVAGADLQSSNILNTIASPIVNGNAITGNLLLDNNKVIRTGTGFIDIATGGDLRLGNQSSVIYTAGRRAVELPAFTKPSSRNPLYLVDGGDINIFSQGSIVGAETNSGRQMVNHWLFRQGGGRNNLDTSWWVRPDLFRQGVATLGGGNIFVNATGEVRNISFSAPTTARYDNFGTSNNIPTGNSVIDGGGNIDIQSGNDIVNGTFFVAKGEGNISAGGAIRAPTGFDGTVELGTVFALQEGRFNVEANGDIYIATTFNPTLVNQSLTNTTFSDGTGLNSNFNSYGLNAGITVSSKIGNVMYGNGDNVFGRDNEFTSGERLYSNSGLALFFGINPSKIDLTSFYGDVVFGSPESLNKILLMPATDGQLSILASVNVALGNINMSDANPNELPNESSPRNLSIVNILNELVNLHSLDLLHRNDNTTALIIADKGDIQSDNRVVTIPKATRVIAGRDITNISFGFQNNRSSDLSLIKAGRDVNTRNVNIAGPGELLVQAGRNVDLIYPNVTTINSTGNTGSRVSSFSKTFAEFANPSLPNNGASITLQAGLGDGANVENYIEQYILPTGTGPITIASNSQRLAEYKQTTSDALTNFMRNLTDDQSLVDTQALDLFMQQNIETKTIFANRHLTSELIASGRDFAKAGNHDRGAGAILALFPNKNLGDILLFNSKVSTNSSGSVDLIAPGGLINVGVPGQGGDIGIITEKGGAIRAVAEKDFLVNQSKVITQFGSDIAVWSSTGTIDAGRGSKTSTSIPERIVQTDAFGNTTIQVRGVAAGSGIRAQSYDPDGLNGPLQAPLKGNVSLIAPIVDAGEAGVEAGDILIVSPVVLNAANIQVQGVAAGVPMAATSSIAGVSAGLSPDAVNSATQAVAQSVKAADGKDFKKPKLPSIISVDVIGIGDEER